MVISPQNSLIRTASLYLLPGILLLVSVIVLSLLDTEAQMKWRPSGEGTSYPFLLNKYPV